ncbi:hypothetical protein ACA910_009948 [Epithemia clementina (nom. ined.)]
MILSRTCQGLVVTWIVGESFAYNHISRTDILEVRNEDKPDLSLFSSEEEPNFLRPRYLAPGDIANVVRRDNGESVDRGTFFIGLSSELTEMLQKYVEESGMMAIADELLYAKPVQYGETRLFSLEDGTTWMARTSNNWAHAGDMTWIDPADEWTYEIILDFYRKAGFDRVLNTVGEKFGCKGLWIDGSTFLIVSHFNGNNLHKDLEGMETNMFNIIFPLVIPSTGGMLEVADRKPETVKGLGTQFQFNQGVLLGGESPHGTGNVDYRETREFRLAVSVYLDDYNAETVAAFDHDLNSFPPQGDFDYVLTQQGRHWGGDRRGRGSLKNDRGRLPYNVVDQNNVDCPKFAEQGRCSNIEIRNLCIKSCKVYLEDEVYYEKLGKLMGWPTSTVL